MLANRSPQLPTGDGNNGYRIYRLAAIVGNSPVVLATAVVSKNSGSQTTTDGSTPPKTLLFAPGDEYWWVTSPAWNSLFSPSTVTALAVKLCAETNSGWSTFPADSATYGLLATGTWSTTANPPARRRSVSNFYDRSDPAPDLTSGRSLGGWVNPGNSPGGVVVRMVQSSSGSYTTLDNIWWCNSGATWTGSYLSGLGVGSSATFTTKVTTLPDSTYWLLQDYAGTA